MNRGRVVLPPSGILCQRSADYRTDRNNDAHGTDYYALIHRNFVKWNRVSDGGGCSLCQASRTRPEKSAAEYENI